MKKTTTYCDLCSNEITDDEQLFTIEPGKGQKRKQVGSDIVLTPRGNRLHANSAGRAMIRVNASFYCGSYERNLEELHFHQSCLDREVKDRILDFYRNEYTGETS